MVLNAFAHAVGLEVGSVFDASDPQMVLIRGSIKENLLLSRFRKSRQLLLVSQLEKLHGSDGCQALWSHLMILLMQQDLVHGALLQFHLLI